jgi:hypothetical protein
MDRSSNYARAILLAGGLALLASHFAGYFRWSRCREEMRPQAVYVHRLFHEPSLCATYAPVAFVEAMMRGAVVRIGSPGRSDWHATYGPGRPLFLPTGVAVCLYVVMYYWLVIYPRQFIVGERLDVYLACLRSGKGAYVWNDRYRIGNRLPRLIFWPVNQIDRRMRRGWVYCELPAAYEVVVHSSATMEAVEPPFRFGPGSPFGRTMATAAIILIPLVGLELVMFWGSVAAMLAVMLAVLMAIALVMCRIGEWALQRAIGSST